MNTRKRKTPRKVLDAVNSPLGMDADTVVYLDGNGIYVSRKEEPGIKFHQFSRKQRNIIREMENGK